MNKPQVVKHLNGRGGIRLEDFAAFIKSKIASNRERLRRTTLK